MAIVNLGGPPPAGSFDEGMKNIGDLLRQFGLLPGGTTTDPATEVDPYAGAATPTPDPGPDLAARRKIIDSLIAAGMPKEQGAILENADDKTVAAVVRAWAGRRPSAGSKARPKAEPPNWSAIYADHPDWRRYKFENLPLAVAMNNMSALLAAERKAGMKSAPKGSKIDRRNLPPDIAPYAPNMTDADLSKAVAKEMERNRLSPDGIEYKPRKGVRLKIVQDEAFRRAGYKSGDTVCIKIP